MTTIIWNMYGWQNVDIDETIFDNIYIIAYIEEKDIKYDIFKKDKELTERNNIPTYVYYKTI